MTTQIPTGWQETNLGMIPRDWQILSAEKFCTRVTDGTHDTPQPATEGRLLVTSKHIKNGKVDTTAAYKISEEDFNEINNRSKVDKWDILVSMIGTVGEVALIDFEPNFAIKNVGLFKCQKEENAKWLYYFLRSQIGQSEIRRRTSGTTQEYISLGDLRSFPIVTPSNQKEMHSVEKHLSSYDNKIELLRQENKTLESIAHTLFKHWFVDFEFPNAVGKPYKFSGGETISSELGKIPAGWVVSSLDQIAEFLNGVASQKYPPKNIAESLPVIKIKEMNSGITKETDRADRDIDNKYVVKNGDLLFSWSGSLDVCLWPGEDGVLNQHLFKVTSDRYPKWFYYRWLLRHLQEFRSIAAGKSTTMGHIQRHHLSEAKVATPDAAFLAMSDRILSPLFEKQIKINQQVQILSKLRDTLLPKLMKGEIRIKE